MTAYERSDGSNPLPAPGPLSTNGMVPGWELRRGCDALRPADQLYLLAHRPSDQRAYLLPRVQSLMLAGGLIGELIMNSRIRLQAGGFLEAVPGAGPAGSSVDDQVAGYLYDQILGEPDIQLEQWIRAVEPRADEWVIWRLQEDDLLVRSTKPRPTPWRWVRMSAGRGSGPGLTPNGEQLAPLPWALLSRKLDRHDTMNETESFVATVALAAGLREVLLAGNASTERHAAAVEKNLPPSMKAIVNEIRVAVGKSVMVPGY